MDDHSEYIEIEVLDDDDDDGYAPSRTKEHECAICSGNIPSNLSNNNEQPNTLTVWTPEIKMLICQAYNIHVDFQNEAIYICNPCTFIIGSLKILYDQMHRSQSEFSALTSQLAARAEAALVNCQDQCAVNSSFNLALLAECGSDLNRKTLQYLICQSNRRSDRLGKHRISDASSSSMASGSVDHVMAANYSDHGNELQYSPQIHQLEPGTSVEVVTEDMMDSDTMITKTEEDQVKTEDLEEEPLNLVVSDHAESDELVIDEEKVSGSNDCLGPLSSYSSATSLYCWRESRPLDTNRRKRPSRSRQDRTKTVQRLANGTISKEVEKYYSKGMYICPTCGKKFTKMYPFWDHLKIHTGKGSVCPECNKIFPRGHNLELHMRTHTGEKPFKCTECDRGFTDGSNLKVHMRRHTGERPYRCSDCNKGFSSSSRLNAHRLQHTGERPHQCQECARGFCTKIQLDVHRKKVHTSEGLPKQACKFCSKQYMSIYTLRSHIKKHHRASVTLE